MFRCFSICIYGTWIETRSRHCVARFAFALEFASAFASGDGDAGRFFFQPVDAAKGRHHARCDDEHDDNSSSQMLDFDAARLHAANGAINTRDDATSLSSSSSGA